MTEDDEASALANQQELDCRFEEEWQAEYDAWLGLQLLWWKHIDSDPNWIREHC